MSRRPLGRKTVARTALAVPVLLVACESSTGPSSEVDPRWSGPPRVVEITRRFTLANASATGAITVRFDTPDVGIHMNAVAVERSSSHPVRAVERAANGMERVTFEIRLPPGGEDVLELTWAVTLRRYDALAESGDAPTLDPTDRAAYRASSDRVQSDHPAVRERALEVTAGASDDLGRVRAVSAFVREHLEYELQPETRGALWALENARGDCTEYATLGVALARALDIPARVTGAENMTSPSGTSTFDNHNTAEFWIVGRGWIPVDINYVSEAVGVLPPRVAILRYGLFTERDRESLSVGWYTWRTVSGPPGRLEVLDMEHRWVER